MALFMLCIAVNVVFIETEIFSTHAQIISHKIITEFSINPLQNYCKNYLIAFLNIHSAFLNNHEVERSPCDMYLTYRLLEHNRKLFFNLDSFVYKIAKIF